MKNEISFREIFKPAYNPFDCKKEADNMLLLAMAKDTEPPKQEKHEPAKLWTKGNLCRWKGKVYEIYGFQPYYQNQTLALLKSDDGIKTAALVEELEEVEK